jgi:hypothetical protein
MSKPIAKIVNAETGEEIEREMNADEIAQRAIDKAEAEAKATAESEKIAAKAALLTRLSITDEEAKLLLS